MKVKKMNYPDSVQFLYALGNEMKTAKLGLDRIRAALKFIDAKRLIPAPDCGMKYLSRAAAFGKLMALSEGAAIVRKELE